MNQWHKLVPDMYTITDEFWEHSLGYRLLYILTCCELGTSKYYFAFSMGEAACNIVGISYNGKDQRGIAKWDRIVMMRLWQFKTTTNAKGLVEHWNVPCQIWLKDYVFMRIVGILNNRTAAVFGTFFTSAFWHGFYGGYYCFFLSAAFFSVCADTITANLLHKFYHKDGTPISPGLAKVYNICGWALSFITITYITISFRLLSFTLSMQAWSSIYFCWHLAGVFVLLFFTIFPQRQRKKE